MEKSTHEMYKKHWWYWCPLHNSLDSRFHHSALGVWFNWPCLTVWILESPFIVLDLHPHLHELFQVFRSSFYFYTPHAYRNPVASRWIRPISYFYTIKPWFGCSKFAKKKVKTWSETCRMFLAGTKLYIFFFLQKSYFHLKRVQKNCQQTFFFFKGDLIFGNIFLSNFKI